MSDWFSQGGWGRGKKNALRFRMYRSCRAFATRVAAWLRQVVNQLYFLAKFALAYFAVQLLQQKYFASRLVCTTCVAALAALPLIGHLHV